MITPRPSEKPGVTPAGKRICRVLVGCSLGRESGSSLANSWRVSGRRGSGGPCLLRCSSQPLEAGPGMNQSMLDCEDRLDKISSLLTLNLAMIHSAFGESCTTG